MRNNFVTGEGEVVLSSVDVGVLPEGVEYDGAGLGGQLEEVLAVAVETLTKVVQVSRC